MRKRRERERIGSSCRGPVQFLQTLLSAPPSGAVGHKMVKIDTIFVIVNYSQFPSVGGVRG
jgi:hypothetical protein